MFEKIWERVKIQRPLIHNISNMVTINDCANILLACGASPVMANEPIEAEEIMACCDGLHLNLGTPNTQTVQAMFKAGKQANRQGSPIVLDPVGITVSSFRRDTLNCLLNEIKITVIRGNISEITKLAQMENIKTTERMKRAEDYGKGVDANLQNNLHEKNLDEFVDMAKELSRKTKAVIVITDAIDIVTDESETFCIYNGHPMMRKVSGTGCQLSAMTAAYVAANQEEIPAAAAASVAAMGICGELAYGRLGKMDGNATYRNYLIDAVYRLEQKTFEKNIKYQFMK